MYKTSLFCDHNVPCVQNHNHNALTIIEMLLEVGAQMHKNFMIKSKHHEINEYKQCMFLS